MSEDLVMGKIQFSNTRIGHALSIIQDEHVDGQMWKYECFKLQNEREKLIDEIADLKKKLEMSDGGKKPRKLEPKLLRKNGLPKQRKKMF